MGLQGQNPVKRLVDTLLCEPAVKVCALHVLEILIDVIEEQKHVYSGHDGTRDYVASLSGTGKADHV